MVDKRACAPEDVSALLLAHLGLVGHARDDAADQHHQPSPGLAAPAKGDQRGQLLWCHLVEQERPRNGRAVVAAMRPGAMRRNEILIGPVAQLALARSGEET